MNHRLIAVILISLLSLLTLTACGTIRDQSFDSFPTEGPDTATESEVDSSRVSIQQGERVYQNFCIGCHQEEGVGQEGWETPVESGVQPAPPVNGDGNSWQMSDEELLAVIRNGAGRNMPGYEGALPPEDIESVVLYMKSLWSEEQRESQAELNEE